MTQIRPLTLEDAEALADLLRTNREFLTPWEPIRDPEFLTVAGQRTEIEKLLGDQERGLALAHVVVDDDRIIGRVTLSNIVRGPFQSCNLGYWINSADTAAATRARRWARSPSSRSPSLACTGSRPVRCRRTSPRGGCWSAMGSSGSGWRGVTCKSPAAGRTTSSPEDRARRLKP